MLWYAIGMVWQAIGMTLVWYGEVGGMVVWYAIGMVWYVGIMVVG